jgi:hypothetical protein
LISRGSVWRSTLQFRMASTSSTPMEDTIRRKVRFSLYPSRLRSSCFVELPTQDYSLCPMFLSGLSMLYSYLGRHTPWLHDSISPVPEAGRPFQAMLGPWSTLLPGAEAHFVPPKDELPENQTTKSYCCYFISFQLLGLSLNTLSEQNLPKRSC